MAERKTRLPWGMQKKGLAPPSVFSNKYIYIYIINKYYLISVCLKYILM